MKDTSSERDWGHHPAGKDQLLEFLGCFIFLCVWNIISDLTLTARIQSGRSNLFKRHNQTEEVIRGSTVLSSTKFFFRIFHQPRNSVVNSAVESAVPARYKKRRFNGQFSAPIPRETKGQTKKKWLNFFHFFRPSSSSSSLISRKRKEIYDSSSLIVRMGLQWSWPKSKSSEIYEEFHFVADIWSRYYSEYHSF